MIEYALIAVLVILGIVFMGPYVLRSVNAHFKLWDESAQDSYTEKITQAPLTAIPNIPSNCQCTDKIEGCGGYGLQCGANQKSIEHSCDPELCDGAPTSSCIDDPNCCSNWAALGCGTFPCPTGGCVNAPTSPPPATNNCYYGQQIRGQQCGSNNLIQCVPNPVCPLPQCLGVLSPGAIPCRPNTSALTQNIGITYVTSQGACSAICQYYCGASYFLNSTGSACTRTFQVAPFYTSVTCPYTCPSPSPGQCCITSSVRSSGNKKAGLIYTVINNQSFSMCAGAPITHITVTDVSSPQTPPGCGSPQGHPGEYCQVSVTY